MEDLDQKTLRTLRNEDLARSGLDKPSVVKKLKLNDLLNISESEKLLPMNEGEIAVCYRFPYFDINGKEVRYQRWKVIPIDYGGAKYHQEPKSIPHAYLPPLVDWAKIAKDARVRVIITEGEKKAAAATLVGLPCIGLGGVWNFKSTKWGISMLEELKQFNWKGREVEICFDSDTYENDMVRRAQFAFIQELSELGADVFIRRIEAGRTEKCGIDDLLVENNMDPKAYEALPRFEADLSKELNALNEDLVYIMDIQSWYSRRDNILYGTRERLLATYGHLKITDANGKKHYLVNDWMDWPFRTTVHSMTYMPGRPQIWANNLNQWRDPGVEPKKGNVDCFLKMLSVLNDARFQRWVMQWLAYPLQNPQNPKLFQALVLWSVEGGTGKTFIGHLMKEIYRHNFAEIGNFEFHDPRRTWLQNKQFVLCEEISDSNRRDDGGLMKHLITGPTVVIDQKYVKSFEVPNMANFLIASNNEAPVPIDKGDRRIAVGQMKEKLPTAFFKEADRWKESGAAGPALLWFLLNKVDCSDFDPKGEAPVNKEKEAMYYAGMSSLEQWVVELMQSPEEKFRVNGLAADMAKNKDVFTVAEIAHLIEDDSLSKKTTASALGKALVRCGAIRGGLTRTAKGPKRLVAIRNLEFWRQAVDDNATWAANYEGKMAVHKRNPTKPKRRRS